MKHSTLLKINYIVLCLLLAGFLVVLCLIGSSVKGFDIKNFSDPIKIIDNWNVTVDGVEQKLTSTPESFTVSDCVQLSYLLDDPKIEQGYVNVLQLQTHFNNIEATIEGDKIYSYPDITSAKYISFDIPKAFHYIPLRAEYYGKTITLKITPAGGYQIVKVFSGMLTTKAQAVLESIFKDIWCICVDLIILIMGLMLVLTYFVLLRYGKQPAIFWLGLFLICYSIWNNVFADTVLMLSSNRHIYQMISYSMMSILGVLWLFFAFYFNKMRHAKIFTRIIFFLLVVAISTFLLHVFSLVDYSQSFWVLDASVWGAVVAGLILLMTDFVKKSDIGKYAVMGTVGMIIAAFLDIVNVFINGSQCSGIIFDIGILFFSVCYAIELVMKGIDSMVLKSRVHALELAAYQDQLTGCGNRRAFDQKLSSYSKCKTGETADITKLAMVMFDSNNLKIINDTYGHACGDKLIINTANALHRHLGELGSIYRIGGDEFVVICDNADRMKIKAALESFDRESNSNGEESIDVSWGVAYYKNEIDTDPNSVLMRAEHRMYEYKKGCKL